MGSLSRFFVVCCDRLVHQGPTLVASAYSQKCEFLADPFLTHLTTLKEKVGQVRFEPTTSGL